VSPTALQRYGDDIGSHPVGAGPFVFVEWVRDAHIRLERNPNYWQRGLPYLDGLEFRPLPDTETRYASVQNGDVDLVFAAYDEELARGSENPELTVYYGQANGGELLHFNFQRPPFNDRRMREAVIRAFNLDALSAVHYSNNRVPASSIFTDRSPYHDPRSADAWPAYDPEAARRLVADYRASGGNPDFSFKTVATWIPMAEFLQAQMAEIGIAVNVQVYDLAQYASQVVQSGDFDLATNLVTFESPFPFVGRFTRSDGVGNFGNYANPEVDALVDRASASVDPAEQVAAYQGIERITNQDLAYLWLSRGFLSTITRNNVKGIYRYLDRAQFFDKLWLDR
jgi:peptide/nickel transport system substrate-binding protein